MGETDHHASGSFAGRLGGLQYATQLHSTGCFKIYSQEDMWLPSPSFLLSVWCMSVCMYLLGVCKCMKVHVHTCAHVCGSRGLPQSLSTLFPELTGLARLAAIEFERYRCLCHPRLRLLLCVTMHILNRFRRIRDSSSCHSSKHFTS